MFSCTPALCNIYPTTMAWYSLFVLKLRAKRQANKQTIRTDVVSFIAYFNALTLPVKWLMKGIRPHQQSSEALNGGDFRLNLYWSLSGQKLVNKNGGQTGQKERRGRGETLPPLHPPLFLHVTDFFVAIYTIPWYLWRRRRRWWWWWWRRWWWRLCALWLVWQWRHNSSSQWRQ